MSLSRRTPLRLAIAALVATTCHLPHLASADTLSDPFRAFDGTVRQSAALQASLQNAQIYSAMSAVDRIIVERNVHTGFALGGEFNWIWGVTQVPGCTTSKPSDTCDSYHLQTIDLAASNAAVQMCTGDELGACAFYAGAITATLASEPGQRFGDNVTWGLVGRATAPLAPLYLAFGGTEWRSGMSAIQVSTILGVSVYTNDYLALRAGYVGSSGKRGLYANASSETIRAFATAALTDRFQKLPALMAGFDKLVLPFGDYQYVANTIGATTLYARKLQFEPPQIGSAAGDAVQDPRSDFDFTTLHFEQTSMGSVLDFAGAYAIQPQKKLHQAIVRLHNPGYHTPRKPGEEPDEMMGAGVSLGVGMVDLPDLPFYGVEGGRRVHFELEGGFDAGAFFAKIAFRRNDPTTLSYFPFAYDSWNLYYILGVGELGD